MDEMKIEAKINNGSQNGSIPVNRVQAQSGYRGGMQPPRRPQQKMNRGQMHQSQKNNNKNEERPGKVISMLDKVVGLCVFMLFFGLPLFFVNMTYQGLIFEKQYYFYFWIFVGIIAWAAGGLLGGKIEIRRTSMDIPLGIFWIVYVLATVFSVDKYHSFFGFFGNPVNGLMSVTAIILAYYLIISFTTKKNAMIMWWAIAASGSIVTIWSFLAVMRFIPQSILQYIVPSLTGSFTSLAAFLAMMLPVFIMSTSLLKKREEGGGFKTKLLSIFFFVMTIIGLVTLSLLFGYVKWYVVMGTMALLLVFMISRLVEVPQKTSVLTIIAFLVLVGFYMFKQPILTRTMIQPEASVNYGLSFDVLKDAVKNKPILGSGPSTYGYNFSLYKPKELNTMGQYDIRFFSDKGVLFESVSTIGIIGAIALIAVCLSYISSAFHLFIKSKDVRVNAMSLGLFSSSVMALLYTMLWSSDGMIVVYGVITGALALGLLRSEMGSDDNTLALSMSSTPQNALTFSFLTIAVAVGVIFGFVNLGKMFIADVYAGSALKARAEGNFEESSNKFTQAVNFNPQEGRYFTIISQYGLDLANIELAKGEEADKDKVVQFVNSAVMTAKQGRDLMPNDVLANETAGFIFENSGGFVDGALVSALGAYGAARELEPKNPYLDISVGKLKLMEAQTKGEDAVEEKKALIAEAKELFEQSKEKTTFEQGGQEIGIFAPAHYYIAITEEALENVDEAINSMTMALQITQMDRTLSQQELLSRQINYGFNLARLLQSRGTENDNKNAEALLLQIIGVNDKEVNSHLNLGLLYERTGRIDEAKGKYKEILEMIPEEEEKSRESIQGLIDTLEQGGSNVEETQKQGVDDGMNQPQEPVEEPKEEKVSLLVVGGKNGEEDANKGQSMLSGEGYEATVRNEDRDMDGVVVMYKGDNKEEANKVRDLLRVKFENVSSERNDEEVASYDHDVVVFIGSSEEEKEDEKDENDDKKD